MRLGIMQPYFFPYLGHFSLIAHVDEWIVFDVTQYTPKTWMNRNRVLHPEAGWTYIQAPLRHTSIALKTCEARVADVPAVEKSLLGKLSHYRRRAPHYNAVIELVRRTFRAVQSDALVDLNVAGLVCVCEYLGVSFRYRKASALTIDTGAVQGPGDWAPVLASALGAKAYLNPAGGGALFDRRQFHERGVRLEFLSFDAVDYPTPPYTGVPGLSILDVAMWMPPQDIRAALTQNAHLEEG